MVILLALAVLAGAVLEQQQTEQMALLEPLILAVAVAVAAIIQLPLAEAMAVQVLW